MRVVNDDYVDRLDRTIDELGEAKAPAEVIALPRLYPEDWLGDDSVVTRRLELELEGRQRRRTWLTASTALALWFLVGLPLLVYWLVEAVR